MPPSQTTASQGTASMYSSNLTRSWPASASPNSLKQGLQQHLQTCSITASMCISKLAQLRPPSVSPNSVDHCLEVYSILARWRPPSSSANTLDHSLQVDLQTHPITASKFAWLQPLHLVNHSCRVHLPVQLITMWWNSGARRHTAHYQHSVIPLMASEGNSWDCVVLARGA